MIIKFKKNMSFGFGWALPTLPPLTSRHCYRELRFKKIQESLVLNPRGMNLFALFLHIHVNMCVPDLLQAMRKRVFMQVSQRQNDKS
jgi:hypothetical protein